MIQYIGDLPGKVSYIKYIGAQYNRQQVCVSYTLWAGNNILPDIIDKLLYEKCCQLYDYFAKHKKFYVLNNMKIDKDVESIADGHGWQYRYYIDVYVQDEDKSFLIEKMNEFDCNVKPDEDNIFLDKSEEFEEKIEEVEETEDWFDK